MLPNLLVIGALKCGTTSLHQYLSLHPDVFMSAKKELNFFNRDSNWVKGRSWYESNFEGDCMVCGESSPHYTEPPFRKPLDSPIDVIVERMHSLLPNAKLVYIIRDPVEKVLSTYTHARVYPDWGESRRLEDALSELEDNSYVEGSKYYSVLSEYLKYYSLSQILVITLKELEGSAAATIKKVYGFLGVDDSFSSALFNEKQNVSESKVYRNRLGILFHKTPLLRKIEFHTPSSWFYTSGKPKIAGRMRARLIEALEDDVDQLRQLTGRKFNDWCL